MGGEEGGGEGGEKVGHPVDERGSYEISHDNPLQMLDYESLKTRKAKVNKGLRLVS